MKVHQTIVIQAPVARVWQILATHYDRAGDWASGVFVSRPRPGRAVVGAAPMAGRICETSLGPFSETIEVFDERAHRLAYCATGEKMPGFVRSLVNTWELTAEGEATRVTMLLTADLAKPFNILMGPMMKSQFKRVTTDTVEELKHFVETGRPHPRKIKADSTKKARLARSAVPEAA